MMDLPTKFANAACNLVGTPFRLNGLNPETGLDCVGLVAESLRIAGVHLPRLPEYGLHNSDYSFVDRTARLAGFKPIKSDVTTGDLIIVIPGPAQRHLLVAMGRNQFVHAHAGLRKVVAMPGPVPWPIWAILRLTERD